MSAKTELGNPASTPTTLPATMDGIKSTGINSLLEMYRVQIQKAIPNNITPERIIQIATSVISTNPDIKKCTTTSIIGAVLQSAILGFDPTPALGLCAFIPRMNGKTKRIECQFMIEYQGYIALARRSGEIANVYAQVVYEKDDFSYQLGTEPKINHTPVRGERGNLICAYAVWKYTNGEFYFDVMDAADIAKVRSKSLAQSSEYSPWQTFESEMWKKSVIRRSRKYVPLSLEVQRNLAVDEAVIQPENIIAGVTDLPAIEEPEEQQGGKPIVQLPQSKSNKEKPVACENCGTVTQLALNKKGLWVCVDCSLIDG